MKSFDKTILTWTFLAAVRGYSPPTPNPNTPKKMAKTKYCVFKAELWKNVMKHTPISWKVAVNIPATGKGFWLDLSI